MKTVTRYVPSATTRDMIKARRGGLTELAALIGVSAPTLSAACSGDRTLSGPVAGRLADALEMSFELAVTPVERERKGNRLYPDDLVQQHPEPPH